MTKTVYGFALAVALGVAAWPCAGAAGAPDAAEYRARLAEHMGDARLSPALTLGAEAVRNHPGDAELSYLYGLALQKSLQADAAVAELERAHALAPGDAGIAVALARVHASRGELDRAADLARQVAAQAAEAGDQAVHMAENLAESLATEQRIRAAETRALDPGSAAWVADRFLAEIAAGGLSSALVRRVDAGAFDRVIHAISGQRDPVSAADRQAFIQSTAAILMRAWNNEFGGRGNEYIGYEISAEEAAPNNDMVALGTLLLSKNYAAMDPGALRRRLDMDEASGVDPDIAQAYRGLDPDQRDAFLTRLAGVKRSIHVPLAVRLRRDSAGNWKVWDVWFGDPPVYLSELAERSWAVDEQADAADSGDWYRSLGWPTVQIAALVLLLSALIFLVRRSMAP